MILKTRLATLLVLPALLAITACEPKGGADAVKDKVNDALDQRPNEKLRDAAEDVRDGVKDAAKGVKDAAKDATGK